MILPLFLVLQVAGVASEAVRAGHGERVVLVNLGLAAPDIVFPSVFEDFLVLPVDESKQGDADLNGDGDTGVAPGFGDPVLHRVSLPDFGVTNLGVAGESSHYEPHGSKHFFYVRESSQGGIDLNGDGDSADLVIHCQDQRSGELTNLGYAHAGPGINIASSGRRLLFFVSSFHHEIDLDGDGEPDGLSTFEWTPDGGAVRLGNLGVPAFEARGDFALRRFELSAGDDLSGDGDDLDCVLWTMGRDESVAVNSGLATTIFGALPIHAGSCFFLVYEAEQGGMDLNGDGDAADTVLHRLELRTGRLTPLGGNGATRLGWEGIDFYSDDCSVLVWEVAEAGLDDFNADGDSGDSTPVVFVAGRGPRNLGIAGEVIEFRQRRHETWLVVRVDEAAQGEDLDGDGDTDDFVAHLYDVRHERLTNLGLSLATYSPRYLFSERARALSRTDLAGLWVEERQDLNGDGDAEDTVLHVLDVRTGAVRNTGLAVYTGLFEQDVQNGVILVLLSEPDQGQDLTGDGDQEDIVMSAVWPDGGLQALGPVRISTSPPYRYPRYAAFEGRFVFLVDEGEAGVDLNSDGDLLDPVYHLGVVKPPRRHRAPR